MKLYGGSPRKDRNTEQRAPSPRRSAPETNRTPRAERAVNHSRREKPPKKKKGLKVVGIIVLILALLVIAAYFYWSITTAPPDVSAPGNTAADPDASPVITSTETRDIGRYYTVLVVGVDQEKLNTDTIMLVRYDAVNSQVNVVSIPRDTLINTKEPVKKINAAMMYADQDGGNGIDGLMNEVKKITGFMPDSYVCIDTDVFVKAIDELGGVYFDVPIDMNYDDVSDFDQNGTVDYEFHIHVQKGYQLLTGENALGVFRYRSGYTNGDWDRIDTQHELIKAVAQQALQLKNVTKLFNIASMLSSNSDTNLTVGNMQWYAEKFMTMSMDDISISTMPTSGAWVNGLAYVTINVDDWLGIVNAQLNPMKYEIKPENCTIMRQKAPETYNSGLTPSNYYTTDGSEVYTNFYKNNS